MDLLWRLRDHLNMAPLAGIARLTADEHAGLADTSPWAGRSAESEWLDWALLTGGRRSINRIVALGCDRATGQPRMVVKFPRVAESVPGMQREARALALLDRPDREPLPGVPRLLFIRGEGRSIALGQSAVEGQPLLRWMRIAGYPATARLIADWLVGLARDDGSREVGTVALLTRPIVEAFEARFGAALPAEVLAQARTAVASLSNVPRALEHRDLAPWNLRVTGAGHLGVLDWESAELNGICGPDLIYALTYLSFAKFRVRTETAMAQSYRALRDPRSPSGSVFTATLGRYAGRVGLDMRSFPGIIALTWMIHARSEFARLAADVGGTPPVDRLRDSLFIKLLREELEAGTPLRPEVESNAHPVPD
ncbi:MAG: aminoglycoside phosphotransferase family protein [Chloroflexi bacterium]|nr:aminoglycoside phosphotransferase family protein [Chloroflexota bacterium]